MNDNHSGMSWSLTCGILTRLMNNQVLTPIEDTEDVWHSCSYKDGLYQCKRMFSLFKEVHDDGTVTYSDNNRAYGIVDGNSYPFGSKRVTNAVNSLFPIEMPYYPPIKPYKVLFHRDDDVYPYAIITPASDKVQVSYSEDKGYEKVEEEK